METFFVFYFLIGCIIWMYSPTTMDFIDGICQFFNCVIIWGFWVIFGVFMLFFDRK